MKRRLLFLASLALFAMPWLARSACAAEPFPGRLIKVVVSWPAGGFVDVITRSVTEKLAATWGSPIIVESKPGAYGLIGTEFVAKSPADGYTWFIGTLSTPMSSSLYRKPWAATGEFAGVAMIGSSAVVAVVPATLPVKSMAEFVELAKKEPGKLDYLNPSIGSASHLNIELIKLKRGINVVSVPYNGQPPGVADLLSGRLHFALIAPQIALPHIRSGKLKALAVAFPKRLPDLPDVPTMSEAGFPEANVVASYSILVPKQTPRDIVAKISGGVREALADPAVRKRIENAGAEVAPPSTPEDVDAFLRAEETRWTAFFRENKMNPE